MTNKLFQVILEAADSNIGIKISPMKDPEGNDTDGWMISSESNDGPTFYNFSSYGAAKKFLANLRADYKKQKDSGKTQESFMDWYTTVDAGDYREDHPAKRVYGEGKKSKKMSAAKFTELSAQVKEDRKKYGTLKYRDVENLSNDDPKYQAFMRAQYLEDEILSQVGPVDRRRSEEDIIAGDRGVVRHRLYDESYTKPSKPEDIHAKQKEQQDIAAWRKKMQNKPHRQNVGMAEEFLGIKSKKEKQLWDRWHSQWVNRKKDHPQMRKQPYQSGFLGEEPPTMEYDHESWDRRVKREGEKSAFYQWAEYMQKIADKRAEYERGRPGREAERERSREAERLIRKKEDAEPLYGDEYKKRMAKRKNLY